AFIEQATPILEELFLARLANESLSLGLSSVNFQRYCRVEPPNIHFDHARYLRNYLTSNGKFARLEDFAEEMEKFRPLLDADPRMQINGHDFIEMLSWFLRKRRPRDSQIFRPEIVARYLPLSLEARGLSEGKMFKELLSRLQRPARI
ncbi:MAG TPA: hypothetical protein VI756_07680, partial [Blastocatellia bacterium]